MQAKNVLVPIEKPEIKIENDGSVTVINTKQNNNTNYVLQKNNSNKDTNYEFSGNKTTKVTTNTPNNKKQNINYELQTNNKKQENTKEKEKIVITNKTFEKSKIDENKQEEKQKEFILSKNEKETPKTNEKENKQNIKNNNKTKEISNNIEYININEVEKKQLSKVVKSSNYTTSSNNLNLINKIEQNLMYNTSGKQRQNNKKIEIRKGSWSKEDLTEVKTDNKLNITTRTSKKVELDVKETEKDNKIASLKDKAFEAINLKEYEIAIKLYKEILDINKKDNFVKLSLATTYHILGQYTQAKPLYIELLPVFPNSEQLISNLLSIIIQESPYEAIYLLPSLAKKYNNSAVIQAQTSVAFSTVERYQDAIQYILKAIYLDDDNIEYKYNLAVLYDITKQYDKAYRMYKNVYERAKSNNVNSISFTKIDERIKKIKRYL
ncbi:MAG: hypothetical protein J6C50_01960 [Rickettsiales bacterium]|nr:hypothetical protein [Rickettsiales bacterium]